MLGWGVVSILGGFIVARILGGMVARHLRSPFGHGRDWMPTIPNNTVTDASAQKRWETRTRSIEARILKSLEKRPENVEAEHLAGELGEDLAVVHAALTRIRDELPVRLKVTRKGRLIHDFTVADVQRLIARQKLKAPMRGLLFVLGVFANIGATWPMLLSIFVAVLGLVAMTTMPNPAVIGGIALAATGIIIVANALAGSIIHLLLTPWGGPRLGSVETVEDSSAIEEPHQVRAAMSGGGFDLAGVDPGCGSGCNADLDLDEGIVVVIVGALLVIAIVALTAAVGVWLRGIWRAVSRIGDVDPILSPASWIRGSKPVDWVEKWIPTNDLVLRVTRVLKRLSMRVHPEDASMVSRVLRLANENSGRVGVLEIMLSEGLSEDAAMTVGAGLVGFFDGEIFVGEEGEVEFVFPNSVRIQKAVSEYDLHAEYLSFANGTISRRKAQNSRTLPSNIPGLEYGHIIGTDRLVAGTVLMQICAMAVVHLVPNVPFVVQLGVDFIFPLMTLGAFALSGVARYAMSEMAKHGVQRDIRRAAFIAIREGERTGTVNFARISNLLWDEFRPSWRALRHSDITRELRAVAIDLNLEPTAIEGIYELETLTKRQSLLRKQREVSFTRLGADEVDEVVFDTSVEHARMYAL